jgi:hypothetical protein
MVVVIVRKSIHQALVLHRSYVPEKVGVKQRGINQK